MPRAFTNAQIIYGFVNMTSRRMTNRHQTLRTSPERSEAMGCQVLYSRPTGNSESTVIAAIGDFGDHIVAFVRSGSVNRYVRRHIVLASDAILNLRTRAHPASRPVHVYHFPNVHMVLSNPQAGIQHLERFGGTETARRFAQSFLFLRSQATPPRPLELSQAEAVLEFVRVNARKVKAEKAANPPKLPVRPYAELKTGHKPKAADPVAKAAKRKAKRLAVTSPDRDPYANAIFTTEWIR